MKKIVAVIVCLLLIGLAGMLLLHNSAHAPRSTNSVSTTPTKAPTPTTSSVSSTPTLANTASVNCVKKGGKLLIMTAGDGSQYGLCDFGDNMQCEEWALFRGNCPVGGFKTTGYQTIEQKYCAWLGGKTVSEENAKCTLSNGDVCLDTDLYNGKCR